MNVLLYQDHLASSFDHVVVVIEPVS